MRDIRVYVNMPLEQGATFVLQDEAHHHINKVLRLRRGEQLRLFNGDGADYSAVIDETGKRQTTGKILGRIMLNNESPLHITLYPALVKGDAADRIIQKAVELGAARIVPVLSARSEYRPEGERAEKKYAHWRKIIIAAAMQCGRARLPELDTITLLADVLPRARGLRWIFSPHDAAQESTTCGGAIHLLLGPEGGFSPAEIQQATASGWQPQSLGPRILRADTAAVAALVKAQSLFGDLGQHYAN